MNVLRRPLYKIIFDRKNLQRWRHHMRCCCSQFHNHVHSCSYLVVVQCCTANCYHIHSLCLSHYHNRSSTRNPCCRTAKTRKGSNRTATIHKDCTCYKVQTTVSIWSWSLSWKEKGTHPCCCCPYWLLYPVLPYDEGYDEELRYGKETCVYFVHKCFLVKSAHVCGTRQTYPYELYCPFVPCPYLQESRQCKHEQQIIYNAGAKHISFRIRTRENPVYIIWELTQKSHTDCLCCKGTATSYWHNPFRFLNHIVCEYKNRH